MEEYALVTGASSGIGKELALQCIEDGYNLVVVSEDEKGLARAAEELQSTRPNKKVIPIVKDLSQPRAAHALFEEVSGKGVDVTLLVNDAGIGQKGTFAEMDLDKMLTMTRLNIEALTVLSRLFLPKMIERKSGKILNLGSIAGFQPGPLLAVYHATKAYVVSLSEALSEELRDTGVTVSCLCPGPTATDFFDRAEMGDTRVVAHADKTMMDAKTVAKEGYEAAKNGDRIFIPGASNKTLTFLRRVMPGSLQAKLNKKFYETVEE